MQKLAPPPGLQLLLELDADGAWFGRIAWSPEGNRIAAGASDGTVRVWDGNTGAPLGVLASGRCSAVGFVWLDDARLITWGASGEPFIRLWSVAGAALETTLLDSVSAAHDVAVSHDARKIATAEPGRIVRLWNAETGQDLQSNEEIEEVASLSWSPKGRQLALRANSGAPWLRDTLSR